jgi:SpoVK/Ycf46/Vps4 family AAA+-type ATPase
MVGSHIAFICKRAVMLAITEIIRGKKKKIPSSLLVTAAHFKAALQELKEYGTPVQRT